MADVSGKGVPAALFMMISKILVQNYALTGRSPREVLEAVNQQICKNNREEMFITVWLGILDLKTGRMTASNAGHEYPVLCRPGGKFELVRDKHGFVIGGMDGARYTNYEMELQKGSRLFVYTDGVPEATNAAGELFGTELELASKIQSDMLPNIFPPFPYRTDMNIFASSDRRSRSGRSRYRLWSTPSRRSPISSTPSWRLSAAR